MRNLSAIIAFIFFVSVGVVLTQTLAAAAPLITKQSGLILISPAYLDGGIIPDKYTAKGTPRVSMPLAWTKVPDGTRSFTLIMHDMDVIVDNGPQDYLHWLAFNIPGTATSLPEGLPTEAQLPDGTIQLKIRTSNGYTAPGAPPGAYHHYVIQVYALDIKLALGPDATRDEVMKAMDGHVLDKGMLVGRFHR